MKRTITRWAKSPILKCTYTLTMNTLTKFSENNNVDFTKT